MTNNKLDILISFQFPFQSYLNTILNKNLYNFYFEPSVNMIYDAVIIINTPKENLNIKCINGNVFCIMTEPRYKSSSYMYKRLNQYDKVFSSLKNNKNVILSSTYLGWSEDKYTIDYWKNLKEVKKIKTISCISSDKKTSSGNRLRFKFVSELKKQNLSIDYFGRGTKELRDKHDGLRDYKYSIAIENASYDYYFTEKIMDCFMNYTVPVYYGCTNIESFFPKESFIWIDIKNKEEAFKSIKKIIKEDDYEQRLPFLKQARKEVLEKYNFYSFIKEQEQEILKNINREDAYYKDYNLKKVLNYWVEFKVYLFPKIKKIKNYFLKLGF